MSLLRFQNPNARIPDWSCEAGERWVLAAPTGWGKSIWLRQLALLRDASSTKLEWRGEQVSPRLAASYRSQWLYLAQTSFRSHDTVTSHVNEILALRGITEGASFRQDFAQSLSSLGLNLDPSRRTLQELSGGELQVVSLVRAVLLSPEGILFDEPTAALDRDLTLKVEDWISSRYKGAFIWVSHSAEQVERWKSRGARPIPL
jgi:putative ABC transport system ATP-binding protein